MIGTSNIQYGDTTNFPFYRKIVIRQCFISHRQYLHRRENCVFWSISLFCDLRATSLTIGRTEVVH